MDADDFGNEESELKREVKKNCILCMGRSRLHTNISERNPEKARVQAVLKEMYGFYNKKYDYLRRRNASERKIMNASDDKRIVLDIADECRACGREIDRANRALTQLK